MPTFKEFLSNLKETNETLDYFVNFKKVKNNISKIEIKLNQLNFLLAHVL
ncbi:DpnII restriction endonuclease, partial [Thiovulum sp. ES]